MNSVQLKRHVAHRRAQAEKICSSPSQYKVCTQCLSLAFKSASTCPICGAWKFSEDSLVVEVVAQKAATFVFPVTAGVAPRIGQPERPVHSSCKEQRQGN